MSNRKEILDLLANGKISADEAAELLTQTPADAAPPPAQPLKPTAVKAAPEPIATGKKPTWFRVRVRDLETGQNKVTVNIPLRMLNFGLKLGRHFSPELEGMDYDELTGMVSEMGAGMLVEVQDEEDNEHVQVYVE